MRSIVLKTEKPISPKMQASIDGLTKQIAFYGKNLILGFASSAARDGADVVALECAKALADKGNNVLLIDTNLRRQAWDTVGYGLSEYLSKQSDWNSVFCMTQYPRLYAIQNGATPPNPTDLLSSKLFGALLSGARTTFDYVILTMTPLSECIDGALVAVRCNGAILTVSSRRTKENAARESIRLLNKADCRILGAILNKTKTSEFYAEEKKG